MLSFALVSGFAHAARSIASQTLQPSVAAPSSLAANSRSEAPQAGASSPSTFAGHPHRGERLLPAPELSKDAQDTRDWIVRARDTKGLPFAIIDKRHAAVHVFNGSGQLQGSTPALLGLARGDDSVPGIGERPMSRIQPFERTTPAGRFISEPGENLKGEDIVWLSYEDAISLHRVRANNRAERRLQRLASTTVSDNRISYGCVNLPASFYDRFVEPSLGRNAGIVYVLPETRSVAEFFGFGATTAKHAPSK